MSAAQVGVIILAAMRSRDYVVKRRRHVVGAWVDGEIDRQSADPAEVVVSSVDTLPA